ncbi:MAG: glycerate kinase [Burkholderiaceae bacterium]|jgi:hypothetical protein|uniref:glycerate kinase n=1 Tax=Extensimonas perlucida TaxID=2590786 RepID=UPI0011A53849|nr:glycerate kinase [Extensimonas perlucida]MBC7214504.1 glycerate kinase [Burkholderiaceae bacterium]
MVRFEARSLLYALVALALPWLSYRAYGWRGVAIAAAALVMWLLLHFTRLTTVLRRAAERPVGYVDSAVMLHARLRPGLALLDVLALARALGAGQSADGEEPEVFRWTDAAGAYVEAHFRAGRLVQWQLVRAPESALHEAGAVK